jgi:hypothetical protein
MNDKSGQYIKEEMGVSKVVASVAEDISWFGRRNYEPDNRQYVVRIDDVEFIESLIVVFHPIPVETEWDVDFNHGKFKADVTRPNFGDNGRIVNAIMHVWFATVDGNIIASTFDDNIFHETAHLYAFFKSGKTGMEDRSGKQLKMYNLALNNCQTENRYVNSTSYIIYACSYDEKDTWTKQAYAYFKAYPDRLSIPFEDLYFDINNSGFNMLVTLRKYLKRVPEWTETKDSIAAKDMFYGKSVSFGQFKQNLVNLLKRTVKRYENKLFKVYCKARKDFLGEDTSQTCRLPAKKLNEEMGVSEVVNRVAEEISRLGREEYNPKNNEEYVVYLEDFEFISNLFVEFTPVAMESEWDVEFSQGEFGGSVSSSEHNFDKDGRIRNVTMKISFPVVDGNIIRSAFDDTIFHETEHLYQRFKSGKTGYENPYRNTNMYKLATGNLGSTNIYVRATGYIIYLCSYKEKDTWPSQAYAYFKAYPEKLRIPFEEVFDDANNKAFMGLQELRRYIQTVPEWPETRESVEAKNKYYGKSVSFEKFKQILVNLLKRTAKRYENKLFKVYCKARKDFLGEDIYQSCRFPAKKLNEETQRIWRECIELFEK